MDAQGPREKLREEIRKQLWAFRENNLFVFQFSAGDKSFYVVRHCLKKLQTSPLWGAVRAVRSKEDPGCVVDPQGRLPGMTALVGALQDASPFKCFSSCSRRAMQTACAFCKAMLAGRPAAAGPAAVHILPYIREGTSLLRRFDVANRCSPVLYKTLASSCPEH